MKKLSAIVVVPSIIAISLIFGFMHGKHSAEPTLDAMARTPWIWAGGNVSMIPSNLAFFNSGNPIGIDPRQMFLFYWDNFSASVNLTPFLGLATNTGTVDYGTTGSDTTHEGLAVLVTLNANDKAGRTLNAIRLNGSFFFEATYKLLALSNATDEYDFYVGIGDVTTTSPNNNAVTFRYDRNTSVNWIMEACNNGTCTDTASSTAVAAGSWMRLGITVNAANTLATYYVDGVSIGTVSTNIPTSARVVYFIEKMLRSAGTSVSVQIYNDYIYFWEILNAAR